jgi:hypothetical protein
MSGWHGRRWKGPPSGARVNLYAFPSFTFLSLHSFVRGDPDLRTAHCRGRRVSYVVIDRPRAGYWSFLLSFLGRISLGDGWNASEAVVSQQPE